MPKLEWHQLSLAECQNSKQHLIKLLFCILYHPRHLCNKFDHWLYTLHHTPNTVPACVGVLLTVMLHTEGRIRSPEWISGHVQIQLFQCKIIKSGHVQIQIFQSKIMRSGLVQIQLFPCEINKSGHVQIEIFVKGIWISGHVQIHHFAIEIRRSGLNQSLMLASPDLYFLHWKSKIWTCPDLIFFHSNSWIWTCPDIQIPLTKISIWTCPDLLISQGNNWIWTSPDLMILLWKIRSGHVQIW